MRLSGIEGLRALAALSVLTYHVVLFSPAIGSLPLLPHRAERVFFDLRFGLTLFFVLSGFLLYRPFAAAAMAMRPLPSLRNYFRSRALRILPAYWVILFATALILQAAVTSSAVPFVIGRLTDPHKLLVDLLLVQNYDPATIITGIGAAWSLGVEVVFYLLLPVLAAGVLQLTRRTRGRNVVAYTLLPAAALLVIGLATHIALRHGVPVRIHHWATVVTYSFPAQADYFAFGMIAAVIHVLVTDRRTLVSRHVRRAAAMAAVAAIAATVYYAPMDVNGAQAAGWDSLIAAACATLVLVICVPGSGRRPLRDALEWRPLVGVGLASYSVYLWHGPIIFLLHRWGLTSHGWLSVVPCLVVTVAATMALSALTYRFVEKTALARKRGPGLARAAAS